MLKMRVQVVEVALARRPMRHHVSCVRLHTFLMRLVEVVDVIPTFLGVNMDAVDFWFYCFTLSKGVCRVCHDYLPLFHRSKLTARALAFGVWYLCPFLSGIRNLNSLCLCFAFHNRPFVRPRMQLMLPKQF
jgi:hypothetical protein